MKIFIKRVFKGGDYTIGKLYLDGLYICDTLEDPDRGLLQNMPYIEIFNRKIKHNTAIPTGIYKVDLNIYSNKFGGKSYYKEICNGKLPRLLDVPAFDGVLIHCGNTNKDTSGCILVGYNKVKGKVVDSKKAFKLLYDLIKDDSKLFIEIV